MYFSLSPILLYSFTVWNNAATVIILFKKNFQTNLQSILSLNFENTSYGHWFVVYVLKENIWYIFHVWSDWLFEEEFYTSSQLNVCSVIFCPGHDSGLVPIFLLNIV